MGGTMQGAKASASNVWQGQMGSLAGLLLCGEKKRSVLRRETVVGCCMAAEKAIGTWAGEHKEKRRPGVIAGGPLSGTVWW